MAINANATLILIEASLKNEINAHQVSCKFRANFRLLINFKGLALTLMGEKSGL